MDGTPIPAALLASTEGGALDRTVKSGAPLPKGSNFNWKGTLTIPAAGRYRLHLQVIGASESMEIDDKPVAKTARLALHGNVLQPGQDNVVPTNDGLDNVRIEQELTAGPHALNVIVKGDDSGSPVQIRLAWVTPAQQQASYAAALQAAKNASMAVVFAWGRDRPSFTLAGDQDRLIEDIAAINPNTIVVLNVSEPIAMPWLGKVRAVLHMWYPGDEGGWATANILTGKANPAGRLPFTWPVRLADSVANDPAHPERSLGGIAGKTTYSEGILMGYRWFDSQNVAPLFPFGFGLSYTRFDYSKLNAKREGNGGVTLSFALKNTGERAGDEVAQIYLGAPKDDHPAGVQFAPQALAGFERITLKPGETRVVHMTLPARSFEYWSEQAHRWRRAKGPRMISVGPSSRDFKQAISFNP